MLQSYNFADVLAASARANWQLDEVLPGEARLDFSMRFMPESLARTDAAVMLGETERLTLNHIRGHEYLSIFGLVEEFILPFVLDHLRTQVVSEDCRVRALLQFAGEEAKHIQLFKRFHALFVDGFGHRCEVIGPPQAIAAEVLRHEPLSVALLILHIEWMSQFHYLGSIRDRRDLEPLFMSLLRHHWMEEAQHAKLDTLMVEALADGLDEAAIGRAVDGYLALGSLIDGGLKAQTAMNVDALEAVTGRTLPHEQREALCTQQHQALRWTYIGSGMTHPRFAETLAAISPAARDRIDALAPAFC